MIQVSEKVAAARVRYIPEHAEMMVHGDAIFYLFVDQDQRPCVRGFKGRVHKPTWRFYFPTTEARQSWIERTIKGLDRLAQEQAERKADATRPHGLKVGDVLSCSWGWEQTNVDFYEVASVPSPQFVLLQQIGAQITEDHGTMQGVKVPCRIGALGKAFRRRVDMATGTPCVAISSFEFARPWDGKPQAFSSYA